MSTPKTQADPVNHPTAPHAARPARYRLPGTGDTRAISTVTICVVLALWWLATHLGWVKPLFLPTPEAVLRAFGEAMRGHTQGDIPLPDHVLISVARVLGAFVLAVVTAVPLGLAMGTSRIVRGVADPLIEFYRPLPPLAYLPLIVIWFGIGESAKILLIYLACFAPLAMAAKAGARGVALEQINAAYALGASRWQVIGLVVLPAALPEILTGMRIAVGFGWTTLVAAEMVAASSGLGQMVLNASNFLRTDIVVLGIIIIGALAYAFDGLMRMLETRLTPWRGKM